MHLQEHRNHLVRGVSHTVCLREAQGTFHQVETEARFGRSRTSNLKARDEICLYRPMCQIFAKETTLYTEESDNVKDMAAFTKRAEFDVQTVQTCSEADPTVPLLQTTRQQHDTRRLQQTWASLHDKNKAHASKC